MLNHLRNFVVAGAILASGTAVAQSVKVPAPSPLQTIKQAFALSEISIEYSRPSSKGRVIFGDLVPFGKIWRTGANGATKIIFGEDVKVEGLAVPAGTYAVYSVPNKESWDIMFYKDLTMGGNVADYKKENEFGKITVRTQAISEKVETLTMDIADVTANTANIRINWENTRVSLNVVADIDSKIMKSIETNVINDNRPYFQAASYYFDSGKDLIKAGEWIDKALAQNPKAYWQFMLKAKIQAKQNDKKGAIASAEQVITLATEAKNDDYVKQAQTLIASLKK